MKITAEQFKELFSNAYAVCIDEGLYFTCIFDDVVAASTPSNDDTISFEGVDDFKLVNDFTVTCTVEEEEIEVVFLNIVNVAKSLA